MYSHLTHWCTVSFLLRLGQRKVNASHSRHPSLKGFEVVLILSFCISLLSQGQNIAHQVIFYLLIIYSSKRGKGGTKRLGLHKGASQKTYIQLHSQMLPKLQNKTHTKKLKHTEQSTKIQKTTSTHTHTKNKLHSTKKSNI